MGQMGLLFQHSLTRRSKLRKVNAHKNLSVSSFIFQYVRAVFSLFSITIAICCELGVSKWHAHFSFALVHLWLCGQHNKWNSKWKISFVGKYILYILLLFLFLAFIYMSISYSTTSKLIFYIYTKVPQTNDGSYQRVFIYIFFLSLSANNAWIHSPKNTWWVFYVRFNEWIHTFRSVSLLIGVND